MTFPIALPDSLRPFLEEEMREQGYCESLASRWTDSFLLAVESNLILYGFDGDRFFTRQFQSPEHFAATRAKLAERLPEPGYYACDADGW